MNIIFWVYNELLSRPLINALVFLYNTVAFQDFGLAIIILTLLIRLLLYPIYARRARYQATMQKIQPKLKEVQDRHKDDRQKQTEAMLAIYKEHGTNPFSGLFLVLAEIPIIIALYQLFLRGITPETMAKLYWFVSAPADIRQTLLGLLNLSQSSIVMVSLAAAAQYFHARTMAPKNTGAAETPTETMARRMSVIGPAMTAIIFYNLPAALSLYWFVGSLVSGLQQIIINRSIEDATSSGIREKLNKPNGLS